MAMLASSGLAHARYGAVAVGTNGTYGNGDATVHPYFCSGSGANWPSQREADAAALAACRVAAASCTDCAIRMRLRAGQCMYRTSGYARLGGAGTAARSCFGYGSTPQAAIAMCQRNGCSFCESPVGACNR
jgi:hypothetical protein